MVPTGDWLMVEERGCGGGVGRIAAPDHRGEGAFLFAAAAAAAATAAPGLRLSIVRAEMIMNPRVRRN